MKISTPKNIHFVGIGGCGMSPLAELAMHSNIKITGSDLSINEEVARFQEAGVEISIGHKKENIKNPDFLVISTAIKDTNLEVLEAKNRSIPVLHRSEFLHMLMNGKKTIAIAGTHGKTTTTAMVSHMLTELGKDPSFAIGGKIPSLNSSCRKGNSDLFVAEADESDGSFINYDPFIGVITNIGNDHMDFFKSPEKIDEHFLRFAKKIDKDGKLILGWDDNRCRQLAQSFPNEVLSYGFTLGCDIRCLSFNTRHGKTTFKVIVEKDIVTCELPMPGKHNVLNALSTLAVARVLKLDIEDACHSLSTFTGVKRRFEKVFDNNQILVIDDYAHNPDKIKACIDATKESWPEYRLIVTFQPHRYTRMISSFKEFSESFKSADEVYVLPVYSAGEDSIPGCEVTTIAKSIEFASKVSTTSCDNIEEARNFLVKSKSDNTIFLTVGAGDVWRLSLLLREQFNEKEEE